jgi:hypothetical protein
MIESIKDLDLDSLDLEADDLDEKLNAILQEKLGIGLVEIKNTLHDYLKNNAEQIALDLPNIVPYNDYGAMLEDNDSMAAFLRDESSKLENWLLYSIQEDNKNTTLLKFTFRNPSIDEGEALTGLVFVSKSGKIRHSFAQVN